MKVKKKTFDENVLHFPIGTKPKKKIFDESDLPVSIDTKTKKFILGKDLKIKNSGKKEIVALENLDDESIGKLVVERIKKAPDLGISILSGETLTKVQSIQEVEAKSPIGEELIEIEKRAIRMTLEYLKKKQ